MDFSSFSFSDIYLKRMGQDFQHVLRRISWLGYSPFLHFGIYRIRETVHEPIRDIFRHEKAEEGTDTHVNWIIEEIVKEY
jgi:hypothetical protein